MSDATSAEDLVPLAEKLAADVLWRLAPVVDRERRFPTESVAALREAGLFRFMVPRRFGGVGGSYAQYTQIAAALGEGCLSTAIIWAMHCQQAVTIAEHGGDEQAAALRSIAEQGVLCASVLTEIETGGDHMTAAAALAPEGDGYRVQRHCPTVSYGEASGLFLMTMRAEKDSNPEDIRLVLVPREGATVTVEGDWEALGMHGSRTVPMRFDACVPKSALVGNDYRNTCLKTMIPAGQLGCSAAWFGAARGSYKRFVRWLRGAAAKKKRNLSEGPVLSQTARLRLSLDQAGALLERAAGRMDRRHSDQATSREYERPSAVIELNNVKIVTSETALSVVDTLIELSGMGQGYLEGSQLGLERVLRDVRSGTLMFRNDQLLGLNGRLLLMEGAAAGALFRE